MFERKWIPVKITLLGRLVVSITIYRVWTVMFYKRYYFYTKTIIYEILVNIIARVTFVVISKGFSLIRSEYDKYFNGRNFRGKKFLRFRQTEKFQVLRE